MLDKCVGKGTTACLQLGGPLRNTTSFRGKASIKNSHPFNTRWSKPLLSVITPVVHALLLCKRRLLPPPSALPFHFLKCTYNACSLFFNLFSSPSHGCILRATHCICSFVWVVLHNICCVPDDCTAHHYSINVSEMEGEELQLCYFNNFINVSI